MAVFFFSLLFLYVYRPHLDLHSFPTRRSSDLSSLAHFPPPVGIISVASGRQLLKLPATHTFRADGFVSSKRTNGGGGVCVADRKSTRLNSSHTVISYAVFCLKKKKQQYE